jgi:mannose-6-phosphate isomerase-like protein (cupin superfamily)
MGLPGAGEPSCTQLDIGHRYQVRRHRIEPGGALPSCHHLHRAEHWTVVQGTARVTRDGRTQLFSEGQTFLVPLGQPNGLENPGRIPLILIEVWTGAYLAEDDRITDPVAP